jgi:DNA polymerase-3 subunit beta
MEFTVTRSELLEELGLTQGVVERRTTVPILSNLLFEVANNQATITATDLEVCLRTACSVNIRKDGVGTIPARKLLDLVRLLPDDEIRVKLLENHWVQIVSGRKTYKIVGMSPENFPKTPPFPTPVTKCPAGILSGLIAKICIAISKEESRFTLNAGLLILKPGFISMVATDGHRLAIAEVEQHLAGLKEELRILVPKKGLTDVQRLARESGEATPVAIARDESHVFFEFGRRLLSCRMLAGQFPSYESVLPRDNSNIVVIERGELSDAIRRVMQLSDAHSHTVRCQVSSGAVEISASSPEYGEGKETITKEYAGVPLTVAFNGEYLLDFLGAATDGPISIELKDSQSAGQMRPLADNSCRYRYVVMPLRI